jgi:hypothetical protein
VRFITEHQDKPFFIYLPHNLPHVPLFRSLDFVDKSERGLYGDVVEEIDWSVGQILDTLRELSIDQRTIVWFTSDNGPWLSFDSQGGSAGLLREGKGMTSSPKVRTLATPNQRRMIHRCCTTWSSILRKNGTLPRITRTLSLS